MRFVLDFYINDSFALTSIKQKWAYYNLQKYHYFITSPNCFAQKRKRMKVWQRNVNFILRTLQKDVKMTCACAWSRRKSHLHFYLHKFFFTSPSECKLLTIVYTTPFSGLGDKKRWKFVIERRQEKYVVFKSLLKTKLEKSAIWLILSVFIVHHHCLWRRIIQRSLLQNSINNLCPTSMVRGIKVGFQKPSPRSKEKRSPLSDSHLVDKEKESYENGRVSGLLYARS